MRYSFSIVLCVALFAGCNLLTSPVFLNLDFEQEIGNTGVPYSWYYYNLEGYNIKLVNKAKGKGKCLNIYSEKTSPYDFQGIDSLTAGSFIGRLSVDMVRGKQVEVKARIKTKALTRYAGLFIVAERKDEIAVSVSEPGESVRGTKDWQTVSLRMHIPEDASHVQFGGRMAGMGTAWFDDFEIRIEGRKLADAKPDFREPTEEELAWLRNICIPLKTTDPEIYDTKGMRKLGEWIGNARMVGLGSGPYGSGEICRMKSKIARYLIEHKQFGLLATEASPAGSENLSLYIEGGKGNAESLIYGMDSWQWRTWEFRELIKWMRSYYTPETPVRIGGFATESYKLELGEIGKALRSYSAMYELIQELHTYTPPNYWGENKAIPDGVEQHEKVNRLFASVDSLIATHITEEAERKHLHRNLHIVRQVSESRMDTKLYYHTENFRLLTNDYPGRKTILWGHNEEVRRTGGALGGVLADSLGTDYLSIGFTFHTGTYYATGHLGPASYKAQDSYPGTFEYIFHCLDEPIVMVDLRKIREDRSSYSEHLRKCLLFRKTSTYNIYMEFFEASLADDFDLLVFINTSSASRHSSW